MSNDFVLLDSDDEAITAMTCDGVFMDGRWGTRLYVWIAIAPGKAIDWTTLHAEYDCERAKIAAFHGDPYPPKLRETCWDSLAPGD